MAGPERPMSNLSGRLGRRGERSVEGGEQRLLNVPHHLPGPHLFPAPTPAPVNAALTLASNFNEQEEPDRTRPGGRSLCLSPLMHTSHTHASHPPLFSLVRITSFLTCILVALASGTNYVRLI